MTRVDPGSMVCHAHHVQACVVCMVEDYVDWNQARRERRQRLRRERLATPVWECYDLGGEG